MKSQTLRFEVPRFGIRGKEALPVIRSYVLDDWRVKDERTGLVCDPASVLGGDIDAFVRAALLRRSAP